MTVYQETVHMKKSFCILAKIQDEFYLLFEQKNAFWPKSEILGLRNCVIIKLRTQAAVLAQSINWLIFF